MEDSDEKEKVSDVVKENNVQKRKVSKSDIIILLIVIILAVLIIGLSYMKKTSENNKNNNSSTSTNVQNTNQTQNSVTNLFENMRSPDTDKPIIYLYPEETTEVEVKLGKPEIVTCSYPEYKEGWKVIAKPDGTLVDTETGRKLYSLYWEGEGTTEVNYKEGFVVKGEDTIEFLEEKLEILGLTEREAEEFIVYWLPKMQNNKYNYIRFATMEEINEYMPLEFSVEPDTLIRVLMQFKGLDEYIEIEEQKLITPNRTGFVAVEWGGTELN